MAFFARLRELAAAPAAPGARPAGGLEVDATRVAAAGWHEAAARSAPPARVTEGGEPEVRWPASAGSRMVAAAETRRRDAPAPPLAPAATTAEGHAPRTERESDRDRLAPAAREPAGFLDPPRRPVTSARNGDAVAPHDGVVARHDHVAAPPAGAPARPPLEAAAQMFGASEPARSASPRLETGDPARPAPPRVVTSEPAPPARPQVETGEPARPAPPPVETGDPGLPHEAGAPPSPGRDDRRAARSDPEERAREALVEVRRWMEEPPARAAIAAAPAVPPPPVVEDRTELSIGTIQVTVEAPPAAPRRAPVRSTPSPPPRRDAVPRDYLRGW